MRWVVHETVSLVLLPAFGIYSSLTCTVTGNFAHQFTLCQTRDYRRRSLVRPQRHEKESTWISCVRVECHCAVSHSSTSLQELVYCSALWPRYGISSFQGTDFTKLTIQLIFSREVKQKKKKNNNKKQKKKTPDCGVRDNEQLLMTLRWTYQKTALWLSVNITHLSQYQCLVWTFPAVSTYKHERCQHWGFEQTLCLQLQAHAPTLALTESHGKLAQSMQLLWIER